MNIGNEWCHTDLSRDVECPLELTPGAYSPERTRMVLAYFANQARYVRRDVDGDGQPETFCNFFVRDVLAALGLYIPRGLVNVLIPWFSAPEGVAAGWRPENFEAARRLASTGIPVVAMAGGTNGKHGHIALCVPPLADDAVPGRIMVAQAGRTNSNYIELSRAFGHSRVNFFAHA